MMMNAGASHGAQAHAHDHAHDHAHADADELDEEYLANDPTLSSCCERDRRDYNKAMKLKAALTAHDPTSGGVRFRQQLFQPPAATPSAPVQHTIQSVPHDHQHEHLSDSDEFDSDDDDDFGMAELLAARRLELEQAARDAANGFGVVQSAMLAALTQQLQREREVPVVALFVSVSPAAAHAEALLEVQREMAVVAKRFIGSRFYVVPCSDREADDALRLLRLRRLPSVAAFRGGERIDAVVLEDSSLAGAAASVLWEARLLPWLTMCGVLSTDRFVPATRPAPRKDTKGGDDGDEGEERGGFDCGVADCRLRFGYEHEHVGTSQQIKDEIAAWRRTD